MLPNTVTPVLFSAPLRKAMLRICARGSAPPPRFAVAADCALAVPVPESR
jgi:hypothetical protein